MTKHIKHQSTELLQILQNRFEQNIHRHKDIKWEEIKAKLDGNPQKLWTLQQMEATGGEPDVVILDKNKNTITFVDCAKESPKERRSLCYDHDALMSRKLHKPVHSALGLAAEWDVLLLNEEQYKALQKIETVDTKTSSWLHTPEDVRKHGGAIFGDYRFGRVFIYHNGAESYYSSRGFRGILELK